MGQLISIFIDCWPTKPDAEKWDSAVKAVSYGQQTIESDLKLKLNKQPGYCWHKVLS